MRLDRDIELDSEAYRQRRRDAIDNFERGGVEVAPAHYYRRDVETSTISDSYYYGSRNSIELQGYVSSSQAPDTNSYYESSDYRVCCLLFFTASCLAESVLTCCFPCAITSLYYVVVYITNADHVIVVCLFTHRTRMEIVCTHNRPGTDCPSLHSWGKSLW